MTAPARLLQLRIQGFKSFAERTLVEFGPGISAVVGPNGSGKSNLADALRWALGEQGRSLRTRKSEDVIWAGSEKRAAIGLADVQLVLDNSDGLLPVDFSVVELGRRLFRSGENEYQLNRQRVRLKDLVDLLDAANLADNAFLFIGQGMVDQALALRPEERRPLFEEVAGVRRHERRRRKAEEQLAEGSANLARVEDILAELRPQARRLAAQAEQQATRSSAGAELAAALVAAAHARWHDAAARVASTVARREAAARAAEEAMAALAAAEGAAGALAAELETRAAAERERRDAHERARSELTAMQLREARLAGDLEAIERDRRRLADERSAAESSAVNERRVLASDAVPPRDVDAEAALAEAERQLAEALSELGTLRAASRARGEELAAVRRAEHARQAELETARRRLTEAERRAREERDRMALAITARDDATRIREQAALELSEALDAEQAAVEAGEAARRAVEEADAARPRLREALESADAARGALIARIAALETRLSEEETRGIARAARRHGGRRVDEELVVEAELRPAVEAALAETARAYLVERSAVTRLADERGVVVVSEAARTGGRGTDSGAGPRRLLDRVAELGGRPLAEAVRRDPAGGATAALIRSVVLPDLDACLAVQDDLPPGWQAVPRDGAAVVTALAVTFGRGDGPLELRAEIARLGGELERVAPVREAAAEELARADATASDARLALERRRGEESAAVAARRRAEEAERLAIRSHEAAMREASWHAAQAERLEREAATLSASVATHESAALEVAARSQAGGDDTEAPSAIAAWETRVGELRARRDRLATEQAERDVARRDAEMRRARAEAAVALAEQRVVAADRESARLGARRSELEVERDTLRGELAGAVAAEARAREELDAIRAADAADRARLGDAEREASVARERLRGADERLRAADHDELEARLGLEGLREQLLVELAGIGDLGVRELRRAAGSIADEPQSMDGDRPADGDAGETDAESAALESALSAVAPAWAATAPESEPPSSVRLAQLRRRYHELGAANPYAVDEYAELKVRVETLEAQRADLDAAIARTRDLIAELNRMIAEQFATTFRALEVAFDRQFNQLFGGGYAKLSLTDPDDAGSSGVDITARPPGKKAQALAMLSGGERALTAVALLFAMLEVRPVPFCVLDEVDAALDEANVGRFCGALRGLADRTQFVVITHNRGTIESADALYGVTVGDDSVSRVISLRLDEARAIAERRTGAEAAGVAVGP